MNSYSQEYIDECRSRIALHLSAYRGLLAVARHPAATASTTLASAIEAFESTFFNNLILVLDACFVHRSRTMEKKDGNPLNEVRILCNSIKNGQSRVGADKTIKSDPTKSVLKYQVGDEIRLHDADFVRLSDAFFAEIGAKYL